VGFAQARQAISALAVIAFPVEALGRSIFQYWAARRGAHGVPQLGPNPLIVSTRRSGEQGLSNIDQVRRTKG
jgi:hypothetical protein